MQPNNPSTTYMFLLINIANQWAAAFEARVSLNSGCGFKQLRVSYLAKSNTLSYLFADYQDITRNYHIDAASNLASGSGDRSHESIVQFSSFASIDISKPYNVVPFLSGFQINKPNSSAQLQLTTTLYNSTYYRCIHKTGGSTTVNRAIHYALVYNQEGVSETQNQFLDRLYKIGANSVQQSLSLVATRYDNFHSGVNCFNISNNKGLNFNMTVSSLTVSLSSSLSYVFLNISIINNRLRQCPTTEPMFLNNMCYSACPDGYYPNTTHSFCVACHYSCLTCSSVACLTCDSTRNLTSGTCPCATGYFANNTVCLQCNTTCISCTSLTVCQQCPGGMTISGGGCICNSGQYYSVGGCLPCPSNCSSCLSDIQCTGCLYGLQLVNGVCQCNLSSEYLKATVCQSCGIPLPGCVSCNNNSICLQCSSPMTVVNGVCQCPLGQFYAAGCQICHASCLTCSSASSCLSCVNATMIMTGLCQCPTGYYFNNTDCVACSPGCLSCTSVECLSCQLPSILSSGVCVCQPAWYFDGLQCQQCHVSCGTCTDGTSCLTCPPGMIHNVLCECVGYWDPAIGACSSCPAGCQTCNSTECLSCTSNRTLMSGVCQCSMGFYGVDCVACDPSCQQCDGLQCQICLASNTVVSGMQCICLSGYYNSSGVCIPCSGNCRQCSSSTVCTSCNSNMVVQSGTCGCPALMVDVLGVCVCQGQCDDGNNIDGDGCTNCTIDNGYQCNGSVCTRLYSMQLMLLTKDPLSNSLSMDIRIQPSNINCNQDILVNLTNVQCSVNGDTLTITGQYVQDLQDSMLNVTWIGYTALPVTVHPSNGIGAYVYTDEVYQTAKVLQYVSWTILALAVITLLLSIPRCVYIGIQTVGVVQVSCLALLLVDAMHPQLYSVSTLSYLNRVHWTDWIIDYQMILVLLPYLVAVPVYLFKSHWRTVLSFSMVTACLTVYFSTVAVCQWILAPDNGIYNYVMIALFGISIVGALVVYSRLPFTTDCQNILYYLVVVQRILLSVSLVVAGMASVWICCCLPLITMVYTVIKKPYSQTYNNIRLIVNQACTILILVLYCLHSVTQALASSSAYLVIGLLFIVIIINNAAMVKYWLTANVTKNVSAPEQQTVAKQSLIEQPMLVRQFNISKALNKRIAFGSAFHRPQKFDMPLEERNSELKSDRVEILQTVVQKQPKVVLENQQWTEEEKQSINDNFDAI